MFPWNYGFHWSITSYIFLGALYTVLAVVAATVASAFWRARRALRTAQAERIRWLSDFHDLPARDRDCRHVLTAEFKSRECQHAFDCRECEIEVARTSRFVLPFPHDESEIFGMSFPLDRFYHRGHAWARPESDGTVTIGLDDLGRRLLGAPDGIQLPERGARLEVNGTAFRVRRRNADVRILSPVDGEVVETGGPGQPWYLKVKPAGPGFDLRHLLTGAEIRPWLMRELERLQLALSMDGAAPALADGGVPVADIAASYPDSDWDAVCGEMFLEP